MAADVTIWDTKTEEEEEVFTFDFAKLLKPLAPATVNQTISSIVDYEVSNLTKDLDYDPSVMIVGDPEIVGTKILCLLGGGLHGHKYLFKCQILTSGGEKKTLYGQLEINDGPAVPNTSNA